MSTNFIIVQSYQKRIPLAKTRKKETEIFQQNQSAMFLNSEPDQCAVGCTSLYQPTVYPYMALQRSHKKAINFSLDNDEHILMTVKKNTNFQTESKSKNGRTLTT